MSGGQRKRVGLARALALDPEVMLYDEPTTGLDPIMSDVINELILQTQRTKKTTGVVVTHDMKTVAKVADRVVMLYPLARLGPDEPQVLYDGPPDGSKTTPTCASASSSAARPASGSGELDHVDRRVKNIDGFRPRWSLSGRKTRSGANPEC